MPLSEMSQYVLSASARTFFVSISIQFPYRHIAQGSTDSSEGGLPLLSWERYAFSAIARAAPFFLAARSSTYRFMAKRPEPKFSQLWSRSRGSIVSASNSRAWQLWQAFDNIRSRSTFVAQRSPHGIKIWFVNFVFASEMSLANLNPAPTTMSGVLQSNY
jgi:hypothetical protein